MIKKIYEMIENTINGIDSDNSFIQTLENNFKNQRFNQYNKLSICLENIKQYDETKINLCIDESEKINDSILNLKNFLLNEQSNLYNCINQKFIYSNNDDLSNEENKKILNDVQICLNNYSNNINYFIKNKK